MRLDRISQTNQAAYERAANPYASSHGLEPAEQMLFDRLRHQARGRPILDLGVGAGRTTPHLLAISQDYVAADLAHAMVAATRRSFPGVEVRRLDARDLSFFDANAFALVVFSCNGIDDASHDGRLRILAEVERVLQPGGAFVFSSHNLDDASAQERPWPFSDLDLRPSLDLGRAIVNRARLRRYETRARDHAIMNDRDHDCAHLTYHVRVAAQIEQLRGAGFAPDVAVFERSGRAVTGRSDDPWLHYLAHKP